MDDYDALAIYCELRRQLHVLRYRQAFWTREQGRYQKDHDLAMKRGKEAITSNQLMACRANVWSIRSEIVHVQADLHIAELECQRLGIDIPADPLSRYGELTDVSKSE
jgi:hypothetical protein